VKAATREIWWLSFALGSAGFVSGLKIDKRPALLAAGRLRRRALQGGERARDNFLEENCQDLWGTVK